MSSTAVAEDELQQTDEQSELTEIISKYGKEELSARILQCSSLLDNIEAYNQKLAQPDAEMDEDSYNATVTAIMDATQAYYRFLGAQANDVRKFLLSIYEGLGTESENNMMIAIFGGDTPLPRAPSIQSIRPKKYIMQIDAISNQLPMLSDSNQLKVGARGSQPIKTAVTLDIPEHMRIEGGMVLSTYDKSIINGVTSLLECGNAVFSIPMLYHAMTGKPNPTVDEQLFEDLGGRLEKMRRMMLSIDLTEESRANFITDANGDPLDIQNLTIEGYLLPLNKLTGVINGKKTELFQLLDNPPLYTYSKLKHQLASVPIALLGAPVNNNATTIPLKTYLLQRVELMKNKNNSIRANNILYDSIYAELGDTDASKTRKMRIRSYTTTILEHFIQQGYISGYEEYKKGRAIAGIVIYL